MEHEATLNPVEPEDDASRPVDDEAAESEDDAPHPVDDEAAESEDDAPHPVDESAFIDPRDLLPRDPVKENQLRLVGVVTLLFAMTRLLPMAIGAPVSTARTLPLALFGWAGVSFLRLGPHGRIAVSIGFGLRILQLTDGVTSGMLPGYVMGLHLIIPALVLWFVWIGGATLFEPSYQRKLDERWQLSRSPLRATGTLLVLAVLWLVETLVRSVVLVANS